MAATVTIGWGKPRIFIENLTTNTVSEFATPVEDSTQLNTNQGDMVEARIEGGTNEAVRYNANTYELVFNVRQAPERTDPIKDVDGVVADEHKVYVIPENPAAVGLVIARASVNVQTSYNAADGVIKTYTFATLKPETGSQIELKAVAPPTVTTGQQGASAQVETASVTPASKPKTS